MSATDDARSNSNSPATPGRGAARTWPLALGALLGAALALGLGPRALPSHLPRFEATDEWLGAPPAPAALSRLLGPGESVRIGGPRAAPRLVVTGPERAPVAALAGLLSRRRVSGADEDEARRRSLREDLAFDQFIGPLERLAPAARCVALLRAHARVLRALAGADPRPAGGEPAVDDAERVRLEAIGSAARAGDAAALSDALEVALEVERERLARGAAGLARLDDPALRIAWAARQHRLADDLAALAAPLDAALAPLQQDLADVTATAEARRIEPAVPTPSPAILSSGIAAPVARVRALPWIPLGLALLGALAGLGIAARLARALADRGAARARFGAALEPDDPAVAETFAGAPPDREPAWLQVVSGPDPRAIALAVMELAARGVATGGRVLVIDAGRKLRLHRPLEVDSRLGFLDCLERPLPVLGLVQRASVARLLLLAHGFSRSAPLWTRLDQLLEEVRPHCDHVVLALDPDAPHEVGSVLAGRIMDGWWASFGRGAPATSRRFSDRIGITLYSLRLNPSDRPSVEVLRRRVLELEDRHPPVLAPESTLPLPLAAGPHEIRLDVPGVLDCDLQVRERLRFMAWMRRVQADGRRAEVAPNGHL